MREISYYFQVPDRVRTYFTFFCYILIRKLEVDFVLLAGYLKLIPVELVRAFPRSIVNIHPSLLPAFGGKGYYGMKVHKAVIASGARYFAAYDVIHLISSLFSNVMLSCSLSSYLFMNKHI